MRLNEMAAYDCLFVNSFWRIYAKCRIILLFSAIVSRFFGNLAEIFAAVSAKKKKKMLGKLRFIFWPSLKVVCEFSCKYWSCRCIALLCGVVWHVGLFSVWLYSVWGQPYSVWLYSV